MTDPELLASLAAAVAANPDDLPLRLHLAELLIAAGRTEEAIQQVGIALQQAPHSQRAQALMRQALAAPAEAAPAGQPDPAGFDWNAYERELAGVAPSGLTWADNEPADPVAEPVRQPARPRLGPAESLFDVEVSRVRLADVGGMTEVKQRLELAFLAPLRNPGLRRHYGKSLRGGLLLYGPPGCGKTFLARALAGEVGAAFLSVSLPDVLDMWLGGTERNLRGLFRAARRNSPCVVFLDEVDALALRRSHAATGALRSGVNQLLAELDGVAGANDDVFVLAATNAPWDVDPALRRPGRLDRMVLVLPPDAPARAAILDHHLRDRPLARVDLGRLVRATEHFSGADLAHLCQTAAEYALHDSISTGQLRRIEQRDFDRALREVGPSTGPWLEASRNVAMFANSGEYDELVAYLKARRML